MIPRLLSLFALTVLLSSGICRAGNGFYLGLLRDGRLALERGDVDRAARDLNLACFGMLDAPNELAECLVWLASAQQKAGDREGFERTFRRVLDVQERFDAYRAAGLSPDKRHAFEESVRHFISPDFLLSTVTFAHLAAPENDKRAQRERNKRNKGGKGVEHDPGRPHEPPRVASSTAPPAEQAPARPAESNGPLSATDERALATAKEHLVSARTRPELESALALARDVADRHPSKSEPQHLVARIAYRGGRFDDTVTYIERGGDPGDGEPELLFYWAVALHETGRATRAAETLKRALPGLKRTEYVNQKIEVILGRS